ncbi:TRAP transporter substrate-binding protein [Oceanobacter mangrovi]|uniref:TRAP transporter substrate-binding protein n=1 Tax=Oceanobacter mangrovi TaxID=2862510 RepID=UPI001C8E604F|nr:TRAP transporter substrate-binding protein [Oceanobacter mangrovi]
MRNNSVRWLPAKLAAIGLGRAVRQAVMVSMLGAAGTVLADPVVMHVATAGPPGHVQNSIVFPTWAKWIEDATEGRVTVKLEYGLGSQSTFFNLVEDGIADVAWAYHGYVPGRFQLTQIVELPNLGVNAEAASQAYWEVYEKYLAKAGEHEGVQLLGLFTHGPGQIHSTHEIRSMADLAGMKVRIGGGIQQVLGERMHVTPVGAPGPKVYEMMQQGIVDGVFMPAASQKDFRLAEVAPWLTLLPGGLYLGSFAMFANEDFMDSLEPRDRKAILAVSGAKLSALAGKAWDQSDLKGIEMAEQYKVHINRLQADSPMVAEFQQLTKGIDQQWLAIAKEKGVDGQAALTELRQRAHELMAQEGQVAANP